MKQSKIRKGLILRQNLQMCHCGTILAPSAIKIAIYKFPGTKPYILLTCYHIGPIGLHLGLTGSWKILDNMFKNEDSVSWFTMKTCNSTQATFNNAWMKDWRDLRSQTCHSKFDFTVQTINECLWMSRGAPSGSAPLNPRAPPSSQWQARRASLTRPVEMTNQRRSAGQHVQHRQ